METDVYSLYELTTAISEAVRSRLPELYWIRAELSEVNLNRNGHCYLELIEKELNTSKIVAKVRGIIFANTFPLLKSYFEENTRTTFGAGIKVLIQVSVSFSELYGISLRVHDIDPSYTMGDMAKNREKIIGELKKQGILELNKELPLPVPCQRIAVISSATAAGYGDFCNQLSNNSFGFVFYTKLFPAIMQGEQTERSVVNALERICAVSELFDAVVIIRGGGATSDLHSFDSLALAEAIAQFPLPIIVGIGHERDTTVLDEVAHTSLKTPTAVAAFLIDNVADAYSELAYIRGRLVESVMQLQQRRMYDLKRLGDSIRYAIDSKIEKRTRTFELLSENFKPLINRFLKDRRQELDNTEKIIELLRPENTLKRGYAIVSRHNRALKRVSEVQVGDALSVRLIDGIFTVLVSENG